MAHIFNSIFHKIFSKCYARKEPKRGQKPMEALIEKLSIKLGQWQPDVAEQVRQYVEAIIELADNDSLDILQSRVIEQKTSSKEE